jgi:ATP-dependent protease ClpP protease subunit
MTTRNSLTALLTISFAVLTFSVACPADTFTHRKTAEVLHGYATTHTTGTQTVVHTQEKGKLELNLSDWRVNLDRLGRNNKVIIVTLDDEIELQIETQALLQAITSAADQGPLFIVIEISTPGGSVDMVQQICGTILSLRYCPVVAFVRGGEHGGAISGGAAIAMACDRIYMADDAVIGAATLIAKSAFGPTDIKEIYGEDVGEKFSAAWRTYLASLAEHSNRPGLLAMAMADKDIEVIEVGDDREQRFIDPANKNPQQSIVHVWSEKGSLLTLTAQDAVNCGIADKLVNSRYELLREMQADNADLIINEALQSARTELKRARGQVQRLREAIDLKTKQLEYPHPMPKILKLLRETKADLQTLISLAARYPDLRLSRRSLETELNSVKAAYDTAKTTTRRR